MTRQCHNLPAHVWTAPDERSLTAAEKNRRALVRRGLAIVVNQKTDVRLIRWARSEGLLVRIDRRTDWGNPYEMPQDGDRDEVCESFAIYLARKKSLLGRLGELRGKVLACWCHPLRCHGDHLARLANEL
jgi:hypothetical protein